MKINIYLPTFSGSAINFLWKRGVGVSYGYKFLGIDFIKYHLTHKYETRKRRNNLQGVND